MIAATEHTRQLNKLELLIFDKEQTQPDEKEARKNIENNDARRRTTVLLMHWLQLNI